MVGIPKNVKDRLIIEGQNFKYCFYNKFKFNVTVLVKLTFDFLGDAYALDSNPEREILSPFTKEFRAWGQLEFSFFFRTH